MDKSTKEPILHIENKKYTDDSTVISLRLPKDMLEDIDRVAQSSGHSRNELLQIFLEFALEHLQVDD